MTRASALAFATTIAWAAPAFADPLDQTSAQPLRTLSRLALEPPPQIDRRGVSLPVVQYQSADGALHLRRGIIAGKEVAPGTVLGIGVFETSPKGRGYVGDVPPNVVPTKRSRRAAVGLSWRF